MVELDSRENAYVDVGHMRITYVRKKNREPESDWSGKDTLRFQRYKDNGGLMRGAELPLGGIKDVFRLAMALFDLVSQEIDWSGGP